MSWTTKITTTAATAGALALGLSISSSADAQQAYPTAQAYPAAQPYQQQPYQQQPYQQQPYQQPGQVQVVEQSQLTQPQPVAPTERVGRGLEYGAHLVIPVWLTNDFYELGVGVGFQGRVGWEFGAFTLEGNLGYMASPVNGDWDLLISDLWLGGGARYSFFNPSALVPFVGVGVALNVWTSSYSDVYGTVTSSDSEVTLGFNGLVGLAYEISVDAAIEIGAQVNYTLAGQTFFCDVGGSCEGQLWLTPFAGVTLYL